MTATLPSNSGEARIVIELGARTEYGDERGFESCFHLHGHYWKGKRTFPFVVYIEGLWLCVAELTSLRDHISRWLRRPLDHLVAEDLSGGIS